MGVSCKFAAYFQNAFLAEHLSRAASEFSLYVTVGPTMFHREWDKIADLFGLYNLIT